MKSAEQYFDDLACEMSARPGVKRRKMFGLPSLFVNGKVFLSLAGEEMVFKLNGESLRTALEIPGAHPFDPMRSGRLMKEWVSVPLAQVERWSGLAQAALAYVDSLPHAKRV